MAYPGPSTFVSDLFFELRLPADCGQRGPRSAEEVGKATLMPKQMQVCPMALL